MVSNLVLTPYLHTGVRHHPFKVILLNKVINLRLEAALQG